MSEIRDNYIKSVYALSRSNLEAWEAFKQMFRIYTAYELERATSAPPEAAHYSLGMNRRMIDIRNDYEAIEQLFQKVSK